MNENYMDENKLLDFSKAVEGMISKDVLEFWEAVDELPNQEDDDGSGGKGQDPDRKKTKNFCIINYN